MFDCGELAVPREIMQHVIQVESAKNPFAIGVVGGYLARQPINLEEALTAVESLRHEGYNFSVGLAQVNRYNLLKYGIKNYAEAFDVCKNVLVGSKILKECYDRAQDWGKAFSCYYSGNFQTGFDHGYVKKIFASMMKSQLDGEKKRYQEIKIISSANNRLRAKDDGLPYTQNLTKGTTDFSLQVTSRVDSNSSLKISNLIKDYFSSDKERKAVDQRGLLESPTQNSNAKNIVNSSVVSRADNSFDLNQIPLQVVGSDGDPYKIKIIDGREKKEMSKTLSSDERSHSKSGISDIGKIMSSGERTSNSARGGSLLNTNEASNENDRTVSPPVISTEKAQQIKPIDGKDKSFVF